MRFLGQPGAASGAEAIGILVSNLGTPDAPTPAALRRYLREFLLDPRVIERSRWVWWLILHGIVLPTRPRTSAALYRKVWTAEGSPLLVNTERIAGKLEAGLRAALDPLRTVHVRVGMRYGNPAISGALIELAELGCRRLLVLPLYPQYSAVTTGSTFDSVAATLQRFRWVPELRMITSYHADPRYIEALASSIREAWERDGEPDQLLFSFHGIPRRYVDGGDPYEAHCQTTARLVAERLRLPRERWVLAFQSLFGREEWLRPYSAETIQRLAREGHGRLDVVCPGFAADCLETIEEMDEQNREVFLAAGGKRYRYLPALNDRADHLAMLAQLTRRHLGDWVDPTGARETADGSGSERAAAAETATVEAR